MSTYSIPVTGPDPRLAFLRALALKAAHCAGQLLATVKIALTRGTQLVRTASTTALAIIGSDTGYQLVRAAVLVAVAAAAKVGRGLAGFLGRGLRFLGRTALQGIALISPSAAQVADTHVREWVIQPVTRVIETVTTGVANVAAVLWELSDHALVRSVTVRAAQAAGLVLAVHSLTQGAAAARVVRALPWLMDVVVTVTSPVKVLVLVAAAFAAALAICAVRLLNSDGGPEPTEPAASAATSPVDPATAALVAEPRPASQPGYDMAGIAAHVNVEVMPDGSIVVHGIPDDLPEHIALEVAHIAADAATRRLRKILVHRPQPNRDDRRLLTKTAREAVRLEARRRACAS